LKDKSYFQAQFNFGTGIAKAQVYHTYLKICNHEKNYPFRSFGFNFGWFAYFLLQHTFCAHFAHEIYQLKEASAKIIKL